MSRLHYCKRLLLLIGRHTVPQYLIMPHRILIDSAAIAGISLYGVNDTVLDFLNNTHMIRFAVVLPIKENNHTGNRLGRSFKPLSSILKPLNAIDTACKFRDNPGINIAALIGTPAHETGTPLYTGVKAVPRPIRLTADIADLRKCNGYNLSVSARNAVKYLRPNGIILIFQQFNKVILAAFPISSSPIFLKCPFAL